MSEKHLEQPRRGRPRALEPKYPVTVWLPASAHDRLMRAANRHDAKVSEIARNLLILRLPAVE